MHGFKKIEEKNKIIEIIKSSFENKNPRVVDFFLEKKLNFLKNNNSCLFYTEENYNNSEKFLLEGYDLEIFPIPVVEKEVLFVNTLNLNSKARNNAGFLKKTGSFFDNLSKKYKEIMLISSPVEDSMHAAYKSIGFAPLLSYENFLISSAFWLFKSSSNTFIKRIPLNFEEIKDIQNEKKKLNFVIFANFLNYFQCEILFFIKDILKKHKKEVNIRIIEIKSKKEAIFYGTDFCVLLNNKIINPVNLMKLDLKEFLQKTDSN
ncbi:MAG: hypothetical protein ACQESP_02460 [Candidatus Muiribacteriota bacterium]